VGGGHPIDPAEVEKDGQASGQYTEPVPPFALPTIELMHATSIAKPFHRDAWVYEEKYDGDDKLISRFEWFRKRPEDEAATPPIYIAFDCLYRDLRPLPLRERRTALERVLENDHVALFPARRLAANGLEAWSQVLKAGYEGLVGKDDGSPYVGGRSLRWLKVRVSHYRECERGWEPKTRS
jgi:ATP-dependent DNA ligase